MSRLLPVFIAFTTLLAHHQAWSKPVERIISLAPGLTELIYSAGAENKLIGVDSYSDYPPEVANIRRIGDTYGFSFEAIVALNPDLILAWGGGTPKKDIERLKELNLNVVVHEIRTLNDIPNMIDTLSELSNNPSKGHKIARELRDILLGLKNQYQQVPRLRFFYQIWDQPLMTLNGEQFISQALKLCGADNVFHDLPQLAPQISFEQVVHNNPDLIFLGGHTQTNTHWKKSWLDIPNLKAVQNGHIFSIDPDLYHRPTERMIRALPQLCSQIHTMRLELVK